MPVIVMTVEPTVEGVAKALSMDSANLFKPISKDTMLKSILKILIENK